MQALLAMVTSFAWGTGNFAMGLASKRRDPRLVVLAGFGTGLVGAVAYALVTRPVWHGNEFFWGSMSGLAQGSGWALLSHAMRVGRVSVVAPIAAAGSSALLFVTGIVTGDHAGVGSWVGAVVVLLAIVFLTAESPDEAAPVALQPTETGIRSRPTTVAALLAVAVAAFFALQSLCFKQADGGEPSVVMLGARLAVVLLIGASLLVRPVRGARLDRDLLPAVIGGGIILVGDIVYLAALDAGPLSVAAVLAGTNPAFTVLFAFSILRERLGRSQVAGIVLALGGSALLAVG